MDEAHGRVVASGFRAAWWLPGGHAQTVYPFLARRESPPPLSRERLELDDGDFLDLDWTADREQALVLVLHGLEGSVTSHYAARLLNRLSDAGFTAVFMYLRGCSGVPNRLPRRYHSGETGDLETVVRHVKARFPERPLHAVGFSLGGNILLKWLGERGETAPLQRAVAVSVPFRLDSAATRLERGLSRGYQRYLLRRLCAAFTEKLKQVAVPTVDAAVLQRVRTLRDFDDAITAPLHGFRDADDYYRQSSCRQFLAGIGVPTLIVHARNDPFMYPDVVPSAAELSASVRLELSRDGGHVGFVGGRWPWAPRHWVHDRICEFLLTGC